MINFTFFNPKISNSDRSVLCAAMGCLSRRGACASVPIFRNGIARRCLLIPCSMPGRVFLCVFRGSTSVDPLSSRFCRLSHQVNTSRHKITGRKIPYFPKGCIFFWRAAMGHKCMGAGGIYSIFYQSSLRTRHSSVI